MVEHKFLLTRQYQPDRKIPMHQHDNYEFVYYLSGEGETIIGGTKYLFCKDSYSLIPPHTPHADNNVGSVSVVFAHFDMEWNRGGYPATPEKAIFERIASPQITAIVQNIMKEREKKKPYYSAMIDLYLEELLLHVSRKDAKPEAHNNPSVEKALAYINEYCFTEINLEEIAAEVGYCPDRFRNIFKAQIGATPKQYILDKRLALAQKLLTETDEPLESICFSVGFNYYSRFSLFFKEKTGLSPSEYRNHYRK